MVERWYRWGAVGTITALGLMSGCVSSDGVTRRSTVAATTTAPATTTVAGMTSTTNPTAPAPTVAGAPPPTTPAVSGDVTLDAPAEIGAGATFEVNWTGPALQGDYITIVDAAASAWTDEPYFYARSGLSPGSLVAPHDPGEYVLWYVTGPNGTVLARRAIRVTPFQGSLDGPAEVVAGSSFDVAWSGPNGPGDFVTIVAAAASTWTNESYFYTATANPGSLVAPLDAGDYVLWYVTGFDGAAMATRPIRVTPYTITLDAPDAVERSAKFEVTWTGPNGPGDYLTIVPAGSPPGSFTSYAYTSHGSPAILAAPETAGNYEIWYASDRVQGVIFSTISIVVT